MDFEESEPKTEVIKKRGENYSVSFILVTRISETDRLKEEHKKEPRFFNRGNKVQNQITYQELFVFAVEQELVAFSALELCLLGLLAVVLMVVSCSCYVLLFGSR